jgi:hypothetical protein
VSGSMSNREQAAALLMREVICEKIYRERDKWDAEHPNRALGVRSFWPRDLMPFVVTKLLRLDKEQLRSYAAAVLDMLEKRVQLKAPAAEAMKTASASDDSEWCYATDVHGENWNEYEGARTREDAIAEATEYAKDRWVTPVKIGWKRGYTHEDFVGGLGEDVRDRIRDRAYDNGGEHAEEYPDMKSEPFDEALDGFVLNWLNEHADAPRFFTIEGEEEIAVPRKTEADR